MHELGILRLAARTAVRAAEQNGVRRIKFLTLEIGSESGYVPLYFEKYFPIIREEYPLLAAAEYPWQVLGGLKETVPGGRRFVVKEIGY